MEKARIERNCLICNEAILTDAWERRNGRGKYCSRKCTRKGKIGKARSDMVGNTFSSGRIPWNRGKTWSSKIKKKMSNSHKNPSIEIRKKLSENRKGKKHSIVTRMKMSKAQKGRNGSNWKGGITPENHIIRTSFKYKEWAKAIKKRDNFECQICGDRGAFLHSNHIKKFADYPTLRLELRNGITICKNCDNKLVQYHELEWESYFNFNLMTRGII